MRPSSLNLRLLGRCLAFTACGLPMIAAGLLMVASITGFRTDVDERGVFASYEALLVLSALCGVVALIGMLRWGHQYVWAPATLGIALSWFFFGMSHAPVCEEIVLAHWSDLISRFSRSGLVFPTAAGVSIANRFNNF